MQNRFAAVFSSIVSRASTHEVLSTGVAGSYNGALQVVCIYLSFLSTIHYLIKVCSLADNNADYYHLADVNGVSGTVAAGANTRELLCKVLQEQPRRDVGCC